MTKSISSYSVSSSDLSLFLPQTATSTTVTTSRDILSSLTSSNINSTLDQLDHTVTGFDQDADNSITSPSKITKQAPLSLGGNIYAALDLAVGNAINHLRTFLNKPKSETYYGKIIAKSEALDKRLDVLFENTLLGRGQERLDRLGQYIESKFSGLTAFNTWLRSEEAGNWHMQLATYLVKLPLRAAQNIVNLLYGIIEGILYTAVHPIKSFNRIARMITTFIYELAQPETWTKMGIGMIAMEVGQLIFLTNPLVHISIGIGAALLIAGLSVGALKAAIINQGKESEAVKDYLFSQCKDLPEYFLTSLFLGMMVGSIQRAITPRVTTIEQAQKIADKYVRKHNLPSYKEVRLHANGKVIIDWTYDSQSVAWFRNRYPKLFKEQGRFSNYYHRNHFKIVFPNNGGAYAVAGGSWNHAPSAFTRFKLRAKIAFHRILPKKIRCFGRHGWQNKLWNWGVEKRMQAGFTHLSKIPNLKP